MTAVRVFDIFFFFFESIVNMSDEAVAGPSGVKRPRRNVKQNIKALTDKELEAYLEDSDESFEDFDLVDVSSIMTSRIVRILIHIMLTIYHILTTK